MLSTVFQFKVSVFHTRVRTAAETIVDMRESMLGVGSAWFLLAVLPCAALGLAGRSRKTARETEVHEGF